MSEEISLPSRHKTLLFCKTFCSAALVSLTTAPVSQSISFIFIFSAVLPWGGYVKMHMDRIHA